jgi:D-alanyl-D-alanine dipeptidase
VTGLLVAIGSYVILYAINPDLVNFRNLEVVYIEREEMPEAPDSGVDCNVAGECEPATHLFDNTKIIINKGLVPCDYPEENGLVKIPDTAGIKYLKKDQNNYIRPELVQPLIKAGQVAASEGYTIGISTSCRPFSSQVKAAEKNKAGVQAGTVAKAGKSPHGYGYALDIHLIKNGRDFAAGYVVVNGKKQSMNIFGVPENMAQGNQCVLAKADPDVLAAIKKQSEILFKAGFTRLTLESWHYEYGTANRYCRAQCTGLSVLCGEATDCPLKVNGCKN